MEKASSTSTARGPRVEVDTTSLRDLRLRRGMTQLDLAFASGTTPQTISRIESGWQSPNLATCQSLAWALDCPLDSIVGSVMVLRPPRQTPGSVRVRAAEAARLGGTK